MYRFLFSSKWLGYLLLAAIFATACVFLGRWQMDRRAETLAEINRVTSNYSATPLPFAAAEAQFSRLDADKEWTQVELKGTLRRRRPAGGAEPPAQRPARLRSGGPLQAHTGQTVVVDRGWLPIGNNNPGALIPFRSRRRAMSPWWSA